MVHCASFLEKKYKQKKPWLLLCYPAPGSVASSLHDKQMRLETKRLRFFWQKGERKKEDGKATGEKFTIRGANSVLYKQADASWQIQRAEHVGKESLFLSSSLAACSPPTCHLKWLLSSACNQPSWARYQRNGLLEFVLGICPLRKGLAGDGAAIWDQSLFSGPPTLPHAATPPGGEVMPPWGDATPHPG